MVDRISYVLELCKDKKVLDLGCVKHKAFTEKNDDWLHKRIMKVAKSVLGVDYAKKEVDKLKKKGYNIVFGDVEDLDLKQKFEVIVAGELLEHLFNPGFFLDSMKRHMNKDSLLIITTPNCFSIRRIIGSIIFREMHENEEHTAYYSNTVLRQLFERKGFKVVDKKYYYSVDKKPFSKFLERFFGFMLHNENKHGLLFVAKLNK